MKIINFKKIVQGFSIAAMFFAGASLALAQVYYTTSGTTYTTTVNGNVNPTTYPLFTTQMEVGSRGAQVTELQTLLSTNNVIYPEGLITGYFGPLTRAAVMRFQTNYGLPSVGRVGPLTLAKLNSLISSGIGLGGTVSTGDIDAPIIGIVSVVQTSNSATVTWATNEPSRGAVFYSLSPIQFQEVIDNGVLPIVSGTPVASSPNFMTSQSATVMNLTPNTTYYYSVFAIDPSGNETVTLNNTFHTNL